MFSFFRVQPFIGSKSALLLWGFSGEEPEAIHVCRSVDGLPPWTNLNFGEPLAEGETSFVDTTMPVVDAKVHEVYYQLVARVGEEVFKSARVGMMPSMSKHDIGTARRIIWDEFEQARCEGNLVLYYRTLRGGVFSPATDPISLQNGKACVGDGDAAELTGYRSPILTYLRYTQDSRTQESDEEGAASDQLSRQGRLLSWPRPSKGHLIVQPDTDERWKIGSVTETYKYKGKADIAHAVQLLALGKKDKAYKIPIPEDFSDLPKAWI